MRSKESALTLALSPRRGDNCERAVVEWRSADDDRQTNFQLSTFNYKGSDKMNAEQENPPSP